MDISLNLLTGNNLKNWNVCVSPLIFLFGIFSSLCVPFILFGGGFDKKERFLLSFFSRLLTLKWRRRSNSIKIVCYSFYLLPKKEGKYSLCYLLFMCGFIYFIIICANVKCVFVFMCLCFLCFYYFILRHEWRFFDLFWTQKFLPLFFLNRGTFWYMEKIHFYFLFQFLKKKKQKQTNAHFSSF